MESRSSFINGGLFLAALTAFLYCSSTAFYHGYYRTLLLDPDVLDRNFHQTLYHGFIISFAPLLGLAVVYAVCRYLYSHGVIPTANEVLQGSYKAKKRFIKIKRRWKRRPDLPMEIREKKRSETLIVCTAALCSFVFVLAYFESKGKEAALNVLDVVEEMNVKPLQLMTVRVGCEDRKLLFLVCGARNCAGLEPSTREVSYFPQIGHSYTLPPWNWASLSYDRPGK